MKNYASLSLSLFKERDDIAVVLSSFAFTMLGFLAAVITIMFSFSNSSTFKKYKRKGYLDVFFSIYYSAIVGLIFTFGLSILNFSESTGAWIFRLSVMSTVNNLVQIGLVTTIIINLARRAANEP
ncbi:hypothetical protein [Endozoicomonas acroporae]|uniref:hypothetical protein n=1 Tax=Endozoicomonas acroporae TaxID=1701104 RepID=UPI003D7B9AE8